MRAVLLAAGKATRLGALSRATPKCLQQVEGQPLLDRIVDQLNRVGVEELLINTHHLADQIADHVSSASWKDRAVLTFEEDLLGTLGTMRAHADFLSSSGGWVMHADNYIVGDLIDLKDAYERRQPGVWGTMLAFHATRPEDCGVVTMDDDNVMTGFHEKVSHPPTSIASAATFILDPRAIEFARNLPDQCTDISRDLVPRLLGRLSVVIHERSVVDIGTPEGLQFARVLARTK